MIGKEESFEELLVKKIDSFFKVEARSSQREVLSWASTDDLSDLFLRLLCDEEVRRHMINVGVSCGNLRTEFSQALSKIFGQTRVRL